MAGRGRIRNPLRMGEAAPCQAIRRSAEPDLLLGRLQGDRAAIHHDEPLRDIEDMVDVVADEQDRASPARTVRTKRNTFSVSVSERAVVGSSMTIRSALL